MPSRRVIKGVSSEGFKKRGSFYEIIMPVSANCSFTFLFVIGEGTETIKMNQGHLRTLAELDKTDKKYISESAKEYLYSVL